MMEFHNPCLDNTLEHGAGSSDDALSRGAGRYPSDFVHLGQAVHFRTMSTDEDFMFAWGFYWLFMQSQLKGADLERVKKQKPEILESCAANDAMIIAVGGANGGWIEIEDADDAVHLHQLYLLADFQGQGIGRSIIHDVCAKATPKPLRLEVLKRNVRAIELYLRLGFQVTTEDDLKLYMLRNPRGR